MELEYDEVNDELIGMITGFLKTFRKGSRHDVWLEQGIFYKHDPDSDEEKKTHQQKSKKSKYYCKL